MSDYLLLVAAVFLVALLMTVVGFLLVGGLRELVGLLRRAPGESRRVGSSPSAPAEARREARQAAEPGSPEAVRPVWRRCQSCKHRWQAVPGDDLSSPALLLRRVVRRTARKRQRRVEWARARGYDRCPSCLSTDVRDSRRQSAPRS